MRDVSWLESNGWDVTLTNLLSVRTELRTALDPLSTAASTAPQKSTTATEWPCALKLSATGLSLLLPAQASTPLAAQCSIQQEFEVEVKPFSASMKILNKLMAVGMLPDSRNYFSNRRAVCGVYQILLM